MTIVNIINGQEISYIKLDYRTIDNLNTNNDSIIDRKAIPSWLPFGPSQTTETKIEPDANKYFDYSWHTSFTDSLVNQWIIEKNINDHQVRTYNYALVGDGNGRYWTKKVHAETGYYFSEACGGYAIDRSVVIQNKSIKELVCLFKKDITLDTNEVDLRWIESDEFRLRRYKGTYDGLIEKNQKITFNYHLKQYELEYTSDKSNGGISQKGFGTIGPTYFNNSLKLRLPNEQQITLMKNPHNFRYELAGVGVGDIDGDKYLDVLYQLSSEFCDHLVVFLTTISENKIPEYVGYSTYCEDP